MAASNALIYPLPSTAYRLYFWIQKTDGTLLNGVAWTGLSAGVGVTLYPDGSSTPLAYTGTPTQIGTTEWGYLDLLNTEIGTVKWFVGHVAVTNTGALQTPLSFGVLSSADVLPAVAQGASGGLPTLNSNLDVQADPQHWKGGAIPTPSQTGVPITDPHYWNGTAVSSPATAGIPDVNIKNVNNVSASSVTTVNANVGTTQPQNFTGTGASALVKVDAIDWASGAIPAPAVTGVPKTDLAYILGTLLTETAGQIAAGFKKFFNIAAPAATMDHGVLVDTTTTATTAVNLTNAPTNGDFTTAMKSSLNASTPASVTTVTGNVTGSIGSLAAQAKTDVAGAVLNAVAASYNVAGSIGALINTISSIDVSGVPAAVWNYLVSSLGATTTVGGWFNSLLVAIKAKTDSLGAATVQVRSVTTDTGTIYLTAGDDYLAVDGRSLDFTFSGMPSFVAATCRMSFTSGGGSLIAAPVAGTVLSASSLRFEPTHTVTATLTQAANFEIEVTLADGSIITPIPLKDGKVVIAQQAG